MARPAKEIANLLQREIGRGILVDAGDDVALLNARVRPWSALTYLRDLESLQPRSLRDEGDPAHVLRFVAADLAVRIKDDLLMRVVEKHDVAPQHPRADFTREAHAAVHN